MPRMGAVSMRNVWLIARREYFERMRTRGFLITTVMIPVIMGGFLLGSSFLGSRTAPDVRIAVVSSDTQLALDLQTELQRQQQQKDDAAKDVDDTAPTRNSPKKQPNIIVDAIDPGPGTRADLTADLDSGDIDGYLWITPAAAPGGRPTFAYTPKSASQRSIRPLLATALETVLIREQLTHRGIVAADAETMLHYWPK